MLDKTDGPFALEIDNIGVVNDPDSTMNEKHAYESYKIPNVHYLYWYTTRDQYTLYFKYILKLENISSIYGTVMYTFGSR